MSQRRDLRQVGDRIEQVVGEINELADPVARARAQEAVRLLVELYGGALGRIVDLLVDGGNESALDLLVDDELVASLLIAHELHPRSLRERVEGALERVRPYLGSHGGDVELRGITDQGVVQLRLVGSCDGCPSSSITLELAVQGAIETDAPEVAGIEVEDATASNGHGSTSGLIPLESLSMRPSDGPAATGKPATGPSWQSLPPATDDPVQRVSVGGVSMIVCRPSSGRVFAYRDRCPDCTAGFEGATLADGVLACAACGATFDVARAGQALAGTTHLDPLPVLERDGAIEVAVPAGVG